MKLSDYGEADRPLDAVERALEWIATLPDRGVLGRAALVVGAALYWAGSFFPTVRLILDLI